jgi:hypothetical protein
MRCRSKLGQIWGGGGECILWARKYGTYSTDIRWTSGWNATGGKLNCYQVQRASIPSNAHSCSTVSRDAYAPASREGDPLCSSGRESNFTHICTKMYRTTNIKSKNIRGYEFLKGASEGSDKWDNDETILNIYQTLFVIILSCHNGTTHHCTRTNL